MRLLTALLSIIVGSSLMATAVLAQTQPAWPSKTIRIVTPSPPGVGADAFARAYAEQLGKALGASTIVENKPGAGSTIGTDMVAKAAPDGHTLLFSTSLPVTVMPSLMPQLPYKAQTDLMPVAPSLQGGSFIVAGPNQPFASFKALLDAAKAAPGTITFASYTAGSTAHIGLELLQDAAGVKFVQVPYRQSALPDLMGGHVQIGFEPPASALSAIRTGKAKAMAYTGTTRSKALPDIPTVAESHPGYVVNTWLGFWAPAGTPEGIIRKLNETLTTLTRHPDIEKLMSNAGLEPMTATPAEMKSMIQREAEAMDKLIKAKGIKLE